MSEADQLVPGGTLATEVVRVRGPRSMRPRRADETAHDILVAKRPTGSRPTTRAPAASLLVEAAVAT